MKTIHFFLIFILSFQIDASYDPKKDIPLDVWEQVSPHLMDKSHPMHKPLTKIFSKPKILSDLDHVTKAGFNVIYHRKGKHLLVLQHDDLPGYLVKAYMDGFSHPEWPLWLLRIKNAKIISELIAKHHFEKVMKVPKKSIFLIPSQPSSKAEFPKHFVLVVEDMYLYPVDDRPKHFSHRVREKHLDALFVMINEGGLSDSHIGNIPISKDGKIAFIDTEYANNWPVHFHWLNKHLSAKRQKYWKKLTKNAEAPKSVN